MNFTVGPRIRIGWRQEEEVDAVSVKPPQENGGVALNHSRIKDVGQECRIALLCRVGDILVCFGNGLDKMQ